MTLEFKEGRTFDLEDYKPYIGKLGNENLLPLPNIEEVDARQFIQNIAAGGHSMQPVWGYARIPGESRSQWTQFFLTSYMMSGLDGGGYAAIYGYGVVRFAICKHKKVIHANANPHRGWHPGRCELCGFPMTYDSGD